MSSASPPRRFKVEPIETTTISSKDKNKEETSKTRPVRRFAPEPIETTTKSNHKKLPEPVETTKKTNRRFVPEAIETSTSTNRKTDAESQPPTKVVRRFAPEPIETSTATNRKTAAESQPSTKPRRFAPEPIETSTKSNRKGDTESQAPTRPPARRFAPEPIETSTKSNRKTSPESIESTKRTSRQKFDEEWQEKPARPPRRFKPQHIETTTGGSQLLRSALKRPKKFPPQLIETAQRSRKAGSTAPTLHPSDRTEATPDEVLSARKARILGIPPTPPVNTPTEHLSQNPLFLEIQRNCDACPLSRRRSYFSSSQHSFRVPDLDPIESSESEASTPSSPITLPYTPQDHSFLYTEATRRRESVDDRTSGYLLQVAAKAAEKQLREQAMAAYPNDDYHEPVDHFVDCDMEASGSSTDNVKGRRDSSFTEVNWDLKAMRKFQEDQEAGKLDKVDKALPAKPTEHVKPSYNPFGNAAGFLDPATAKRIAAEAKDPEMERMRREARPPMLGRDIKFPRCESPEPSRFDPTQGCDAVKTAMCYLSEQSKAASEKGESLWCGKGNGRQTSTTPSLWSSANSRASSTTGLWGGFCINGGDKSPRGPTGILTPHHEKANPLSPTPTPAMSLLPPTPPPSSYGISADFTGIDEKLAVEQTIAEDFGDEFVTQVYNYLSLGYPSMARPFDEELSKISQISVSELRQDDHLAKSRGYIRLGKDGNLSNSEITEETCMRWRALRVYIQEWARQHPQMAEDEFLLAGGRGTAVRKGSWAL